MEVLRNINQYVNEHIQSLCFDVCTGVLLVAYFEMFLVFIFNRRSVQWRMFLITLFVYLALGWFAFIHYKLIFNFIHFILITGSAIVFSIALKIIKKERSRGIYKNKVI